MHKRGIGTTENNVLVNTLYYFPAKKGEKNRKVPKVLKVLKMHILFCILEDTSIKYKNYSVFLSFLGVWKF